MDKLLRSSKNVIDATERNRIIHQAQAQKSRILSLYANHARLLDLNALKQRVSVLIDKIISELNEIQLKQMYQDIQDSKEDSGDKIMTQGGRKFANKKTISKYIVETIWHGSKLGNLGRPTLNLDQYMSSSQA